MRVCHQILPPPTRRPGRRRQRASDHCRRPAGTRST